VTHLLPSGCNLFRDVNKEYWLQCMTGTRASDLFPIFVIYLLLFLDAKDGTEHVIYEAKVALSTSWRYIRGGGRWGVGPLIVHLGSRREWWASRSGPFTSAKNTGTHWRGGWVGLRVSVDDLKKREIFVSVGIRTTDLLACILVTLPIALKLQRWSMMFIMQLCKLIS